MSATIAGFPVVSHFLPQETPASEIAPELDLPPEVTGVVLALSTRIGDKTILTGSGIGFFDENGDIQTTPIAAAVLRTLSDHVKSGRLIICSCNNPKTARARAINALLAASDGDGLFILCKDTHVVDAVFITQTFNLRR